MKYIFLFCNSREDELAWDVMPEEGRNELYGRIGQWFEDNAAVIGSGAELQRRTTATTVRFKNGAPILTDGPFVEGSEVVGGVAEVNVPDLDAALKLAKSWPGGGPLEIRPVVAR
jgi:hypothetical protein